MASEHNIQEIDITLWSKYKVSFTAHPDVNIIVGKNGSGKTTLLNEIERSYLKGASYIYIPSVDNLTIKDKRQKTTALSQDLDSYIYDMKTGPSIMYYRMSMLDASVSEQENVKHRITQFCEMVNSLFAETGKHIEIEGNKFIIENQGDSLTTNDLSSGEKMMLLLLLRVFLLDNKRAVVLIDEPENSLDISWQYKLIDMMVKLNPNAQFFITTHSPSIFSDGWGNNIIYMEDVTSNIIKAV